MARLVCHYADHDEEADGHAAGSSGDFQATEAILAVQGEEILPTAL
jgi:hypothetical protein